MATDTTALPEAIAAMRAAVAREDDLQTRLPPDWGSDLFWRGSMLQSHDQLAATGRALLAALGGVPERLAALEGVELAAREIPVTRYLSNPHEITWRLDAVEAALAALDGAGEGVGGG